ncbi:MAG: translation initiation factor eIF-1A [Candidatus Nanoarchaeia archaeon]|jgi:translation initiation factor 1A|nr:translation initiation factor eIF-1A [Candidatus Nanoarchaeia archaeon]
MAKPDEAQLQAEKDAEDISRVKMPRGNETIGLLTARLGGSRCRVRCLDGKERVCRIPGRLKRSLWVRENDVVLVEPWEFGGEEKGDIIFKYRPVQVKWLRNKGYLEDLETVNDF